MLNATLQCLNKQTFKTEIQFISLKQWKTITVFSFKLMKIKTSSTKFKSCANAELILTGALSGSVF